MALIAAFKLKDAPVVLGDMLVTSPSSKSKASVSVGLERGGAPNPPQLSTQPFAAFDLSKLTGRSISGLRKKVHIINGKFAVSWSGSQLAAKFVIGHLYRKFSSDTPTRDSLERELATIDKYTDELFHVHIIGWLIGDDQLCFRWNSGYPEQIFSNSAHFEGSGEKIFTDMLENPWSAVIGHGLQSSFEQAAYEILTKTSRLFQSEVFNGIPTVNHFGFMYEVAILWEGTFRYIDNVSYLAWELIEEIPGNGKAFLGPVIAKYKAFGDYSAVGVTHLAGPWSNNTYVDVVTPVHDDMSSLDPKFLGRPKYRSEFYCNFIMVRRSSGETYQIFLTNHDSDKTIMSCEGDNHRLRFFLDTGWVANVMNTHL